MAVLFRAFMVRKLDAALTVVGPKITYYNDLVARQGDLPPIRTSKTTKSLLKERVSAVVFQDVVMAKTSS
jgi:hypothetical protein